MQQIKNLALSLVMSCIGVNYLWWLFLKEKRILNDYVRFKENWIWENMGHENHFWYTYS